MWFQHHNLSAEAALREVCGKGIVKYRYGYSTGLLYVMWCGYNTTISLSADWCGLSSIVMSRVMEGSGGNKCNVIKTLFSADVLVEDASKGNN